MCDPICIIGPLLSNRLWPDLWKGTIVKTSKNGFVYTQLPWIVVYTKQLYVYNIYIYEYMAPLHKSGQKCLEEVVFSYKSGHIHKIIVIWCCALNLSDLSITKLL